MNKVGFHIMTADAANSGWVERFRSSVHLVLAINVGGEVPRLLQVAMSNPQSRIIYRAWTVFSPGDSDHFEWYYQQHGSDPAAFIRAHEPVLSAITKAGLGNRISIQAFNETGHDEAIWPAFIDFNRRFVIEMDRRGLSASVFGMGPGHPAWNCGPDARQNIRKAWVQAKPLFQAIAAAQEMHIVNLHEYHAMPWRRFEPWVVGRFRWMLEDVQSTGVATDKVRIVIGESGFTDPNSLGYPSPTGPNGYQWSLSQGYTAHELADDYMDMVRTIYQPHPNLLGLCYYGLGSMPRWWEEFDLLRTPAILEHIEVQLVHEDHPMIVDTPDTVFVVNTDKLNVRMEPSRTAAVLTTLLKGTTVVTNGYIDADGHRWRRRKDGGVWLAEFPLNFPSETFLVEQQVDTKQLMFDKLFEIEQRIEALKVLVESL